MLLCPFCVKSKVHLSCGEVFYYEGPRETAEREVDGDSVKHFIKRLALVLLCTSVCCSELLAEKVRILTLISRFADTVRDYSTSDFDQHFRAVEDLLSELSYNQSEFELTVVDVGRGNLKERETKNLWQTLNILGRVQYTLEQSATQDCDYDVYLPLAQAYLDSVNQLDYNYYGYDIDSLEVEKARPYGCLDLGHGELLGREMGVPADIDLRSYHILISVTVTDSESGKYAYATRLKYSGLKQAGEPIPEDIALGLRFISSTSRKGDWVEKYGHITDYEHLDPSLNPNALDPSTFVEPHYVSRKKATSIHLDSTYLLNTQELLLTS